MHSIPYANAPNHRLADNTVAALANPLVVEALDALLDAVSRGECPDPADPTVVLLSAWVRDVRR